MAYYLGRDVKVWILTEDDNQGVTVTSNEAALGGSTATATYFANKLHADSADDGMALTDLTGVDLSIGATDEDVTYMGQRSVLKAEIKKETTVSLTRKKSNNQWDVIFNGPIKSGECVDGNTELARGARWGLDNELISAGLQSPKDHKDTSGDITFGYRVIIQLKDAAEAFTVPNCCITGHSVTLNADGTTEETMEFLSNVNPIITTEAHSGNLTQTTAI